MGATNNIKEILQNYELKARVCHSCSKSFTELDLKENNYQVEYRTNHATDWTDFPLREGRGWISVEAALYHKNCSDPNKEDLIECCACDD